MLQLRFKSGSRPPMWLVAAEYTFGSALDNDCPLENTSVDPMHAKLRVEGDDILLERISENGNITVNGKNVADEILLSAGDQIRLGEAELEIIDPKSERAAQNPDKSDSQFTNLRPTIISGGSAPVNKSAQAQWCLRPLNTTLTSQDKYELVGSLLLGRSKECDICIPATHLSRKHAKFTVTSGGIVVEDLASSNGTFVNGSRVDKIMLKHGDEVSFDTLKFRVESMKELEDVTSLRPALDETQIRQAIRPDQLANAAVRKTRPVRPTNTPIANKASSSVEGGAADTVKFVIGAIVLIGIMGFLVWYLLS